jgi:hypothetical protein
MTRLFISSLSSAGHPKDFLFLFFTLYIDFNGANSDANDAMIF